MALCGWSWPTLSTAETLACAAQQESRAGVTPRGIQNDCRLRGSAALLTNPRTREMVASRCKFQAGGTGPASRGWPRGETAAKVDRDVRISRPPKKHGRKHGRAT